MAVGSLERLDGVLERRLLGRCSYGLNVALGLLDGGAHGRLVIINLYLVEWWQFPFL